MISGVFQDAFDFCIFGNDARPGPGFARAFRATGRTRYKRRKLFVGPTAGAAFFFSGACAAFPSVPSQSPQKLRRDPAWRAGVEIPSLRKSARLSTYRL